MATNRKSNNKKNNVNSDKTSQQPEHEKEEDSNNSNDEINWDPNQVVRIISISEDGSSFTLDEENLHRVIAEVKKIEEPNMKLMVLSVVGDFRTGKSFILSAFLRYLRYCESHHIEHPEGLEWLEEGGVLSEGNMSAVEAAVTSASPSTTATDTTATTASAPGFLWRRGQDPMTTGLQMYARPFVRTLTRTNSKGKKRSEKIAILLMDTQGLFDHNTSSVLTNAIFGLSTLISSYQIYNLTKQFQEDKLQQLHFFTTFSRSALKEFVKYSKKSASTSSSDGDDEANTTTETHEEEVKKAPFQHLDFLIRDWQNFSDDQDIEKCIAEMPAVMEKVFENTTHENGSNVREQIKEAFQTLGVFLLPHPGIKITKSNFHGEVTDLEENFKVLLDRYVRKVFEEQLVPKRIQDKDVNASSLELYIQQYAKVFKEGKLPDTTDLVSAIALASNLSAKESALEHYKNEMKAVRTGGFVTKENLSAAHEKARISALSLYEDNATFGDEAGIAEFKKQTLDKLQDEFVAITESNELKMHQELQSFIFPLIVAVVAFILDKISDYTCDSWSATCRDLSGNFAKLYYAVFISLAIKFGFMYHKSGLLVASSGFMKLGHATLEKLNSIKEQTHSLKDQAMQGGVNGVRQEERKKKD